MANTGAINQGGDVNVEFPDAVRLAHEEALNAGRDAGFGSLNHLVGLIQRDVAFNLHAATNNIYNVLQFLGDPAVSEPFTSENRELVIRLLGESLGSIRKVAGR